MADSMMVLRKTVLETATLFVTGRNASCYVTVESPDASGSHLILVFHPKSDQGVGQEIVEEDSPVLKAAQRAVELSWTLRQRIQLGLSSEVLVPLTVVPRPLRAMAEGGQNATLGEMIRPLLCEHKAISSLRPFQREGVQWLLNNDRAILADEMGLGKTLQVIAGARELIYRGDIHTAMVLCPKTVLGVWGDELCRWAPDLISVYSRPVAVADPAPGHFVIATYESLRSQGWDPAKGARGILLVLDEAHRVRNKASLTTQAVRAVRPDKVWAVTGTPLERDQEDLATLLTVIDPHRWSPSLAGKDPSAVRAAAAGVTLRRRKKDILSQLPAVVEKSHWLEMGARERSEYEEIFANVKEDVSPSKELRWLRALLDACNGGNPSVPSVKIDCAVGMIEQAHAQAEKTVVFSHTIRPLQRLAATLDGRSVNYRILIGSMSADERSAAVRDFRAREDVTVFLASLGVGAEGITLIEANHAIFLNQWWNPSVNYQARDRIVRIGQRRSVFVHYLLCRNTVDERLDEIIQSKEWSYEEIVEKLTS